MPEKHVPEFPLDKVRIDGDTQSRVKMNDESVTEYAERMTEGEVFPEIVLYKDEDGNHWLAEGFHRVAGAKVAGLGTLSAEIREGTVRDARIHSCGANVTHGLKRSRADKRNAVMICLNDDELKKQSNIRIADICKCSSKFVGDLRTEIGDETTTRSVKRGDKMIDMTVSNLGRPKKNDDTEAESEGGVAIALSLDEEPETKEEDEAEIPVVLAQPPVSAPVVPVPEKQPKNGEAVKYDALDAEITATMGKLMLRLDDRLRLTGKEAKHVARHEDCYESLKRFEDSWGEWKGVGR
jgi:hypothetical protein